MPEVDIAALTAPFGPDALETRAGSSGRSFTYIKTHAVINRLNRACHYQWDWRIIEQHMEADLLVCRGELTIPGLGTKAAVGVQEIRPNGGVDLWKGASSDAMKKAATMFGVGIELYGDDVESPDYQPQQQTNRGPVTTSSARYTASGQSGSRIADSRTTDTGDKYAPAPSYTPRPQASRPTPARSAEATIDRDDAPSYGANRYDSPRYDGG